MADQEDQIEELSVRFLEGDDSCRDQLVELFLAKAKRIGISVAYRAGRSDAASDAAQEAVAVFLDALNRAREKMQDTNLDQFLTTTVNFRVRDYVYGDRVVNIPGRRHREKVKEGKTVTGYSATGDVERFQPVSPTDDELSPEFREAWNMAIRTDEEKQIISLRLAGSTLTQIQDVVGKSKSQVGNILHRIEKRFDQYYA